MRLLSQIKTFFERQVYAQAGDRVVVAYSGGPDSTALLWGMTQVAAERDLRVHAAHVDHAIDEDSSRRAAVAARICKRLDTPLRTIRRRILEEKQPGENLEAAARRVRYECLEQERRRLGARYVITAHHGDDQIETVLLRMLFGSGIEGLVGIRARHGKVVRPLLHLRKRHLVEALDTLGLDPAEDPTNFHLQSVRNRLRHLSFPALVEKNPGLDDRLLSMALAADGARRALESRLRERVCPTSSERGPEIDCESLVKLPEELWPFALSLLHREAGRPYPPSAAARIELARQLRQGGRVGCDCGDGWRWEVDGRRLGLHRMQPPVPSFAYTVEAPGECVIRELALRFRIRQGAVDEWMFQSSTRRVGLSLPLASGDSVVVRNRRDGDRIRPFGCSYTRRLKDVLIDRHVPRHQRNRLALLQVGTRVTWVPGVTIDNDCRVEAGGKAWIAELESI